MRKICLKIHKWLALPFGLFMAILCFTGFLIIAVKDLSLLLGMEESVKPFLSSVTRLHRWLFMKPDNPHGGLSVGRVVMAISSMCMVLVLLTGVVVWWPKSKKPLKGKHKQGLSPICLRYARVVRHLCLCVPVPHGSYRSCVFVRLVQARHVETPRTEHREDGKQDAQRGR